MEDSYDTLMRPLLAATDGEEPKEDLSYSELNDRASAQQQVIAGIYREMLLGLQHQLMAHIHAQSHSFFETLIIDVVLALGYAGRRRDLARQLGRSGDGGVDGIVNLDELGLDAIYLQAKRLKPSYNVSASAVRDFIGSLETHKASKGVFVTTGGFTARAREAAELAQKRVVLIDGATLTNHMVRHSIGTRLVETFQFKELDLNYFCRVSNGGKTLMASHR